MNKEELDIILVNHKKWLNDEVDGVKANLGYTDLRYTDLRNADLSDADLSSADLRNTDLRNADLRNADLIDADLRYTDLIDADLSGADLRNADLSGADLRNADLIDADLDFSCLPLWCGSLYAKFDKKHYIQFLYHTLKSLEQNDLIDERFKNRFLTKNNIKLANEFHRVEECGEIGENNGN